ncbi:MAG: helix-turn-helix domain-containing protein [Defluviitaleaceae bacterium]|nr:helix-turn-helix domain-containing protein [Defluviitaleaceae bacterium]
MEKTIKEKLLKEFFEIIPSDASSVDKLSIKIQKEIKKNPDDELLLALHALKVHQSINNRHSFDVTCTVAEPIFKQLKDIQNWGYTELHVISLVIGYTLVYCDGFSTFEEAVDLINDDYMDVLEFEKVRSNLYYNFMVRMVRAKYFDTDTEIDEKKLNATFSLCYNHLMKICLHKESLRQHVLTVLKGVFEDSIALVREGLDTLLDSGDKKLYRRVLDGVIECIVNMSTRLKKPFLDFFIGHQIRKCRIERNMSVLDLAAAIDADQSTMSAIERGDGGVSMERLVWIAEVLQVKIQYFFGDDSAKKEIEDPFILTVKAYTDGITEEEKQHVLIQMQHFLNHKYPNRGKTGGAKPQRD